VRWYGRGVRDVAVLFRWWLLKDLGLLRRTHAVVPKLDRRVGVEGQKQGTDAASTAALASPIETSICCDGRVGADRTARDYDELRHPCPR